MAEAPMPRWLAREWALSCASLCGRRAVGPPVGLLLHRDRWETRQGGSVVCHVSGGGEREGEGIEMK